MFKQKGSFLRRQESIISQGFLSTILDIVMPIGLDDKEHNDCKLSYMDE
ncbi:hypothetical protein [Candidatus Tisiphia endosymbiont of Hybos culiciformis]